MNSRNLKWKEKEAKTPGTKKKLKKITLFITLVFTFASAQEIPISTSVSAMSIFHFESAPEFPMSIPVSISLSSNKITQGFRKILLHNFNKYFETVTFHILHLKLVKLPKLHHCTTEIT